MFSPLKKAYAEHAKEVLDKGRKGVDKTKFLAVMHKAVQDSFSVENILTAWRKTGLRPVNRGAIPDAALAPSKEFSRVHTLPLPPPSPIRAVIDAIHQQNRGTFEVDHEEDLLEEVDCEEEDLLEGADVSIISPDLLESMGM